jgi:hypothetical protein
MSSFQIKAKHKQSGEIREIWCMDDYFGKHKYGYIPNIEGGSALAESIFHELYEPIQPNSEA